MERIHTLIEKLHQQKLQASPPSHLLFTVQLLHQELIQLQKNEGASNSKRVSVTMPLNFNYSAEALRTPFNEADKEKEIFVLDVVADGLDDDEETVPIIEVKDYVLRKPAVEKPFVASPVIKQEEPRTSYAQQPLFNSAFDTVTEAPTLTQYASRREVNNAVADIKESLNDRLKEDRTELAHRLKESPVKDLKKAIGINDRFVFVSQLFRGDEAMYERSIKTINGFNIYSEAEYWMARELKLKLAWAEQDENVQHFYSLVRRRFS